MLDVSFGESREKEGGKLKRWVWERLNQNSFSNHTVPNVQIQGKTPIHHYDGISNWHQLRPPDLKANKQRKRKAGGRTAGEEESVPFPAKGIFPSHFGVAYGGPEGVLGIYLYTERSKGEATGRQPTACKTAPFN